MNAFLNFERIRDHIIRQKEEQTEPSKYWEEELESIEYIYEASPLLIARIRDHCHWITGIRSYEYKNHHSKNYKIIHSRYLELESILPSCLIVGENNILGDFGFKINGELFNIDTLKYHETIIALSKFGVLDKLNNSRRPVILEIGAGWGGLSSMLLRHLPNAQIIIVDLPTILLFSGTYLPTAYPNKRIGFYGAKDFSGDEDIIFVTPTQFMNAHNLYPDIAINTVSFQEMTSTQVSEYGKKLIDLGVPLLYHHNRQKSKYNSELISVNSSLVGWNLLFNLEIGATDYTLSDRNPKPSQKFIKNLFSEAISKDRYKHYLLGNSNPLKSGEHRK